MEYTFCTELLEHREKNVMRVSFMYCLSLLGKYITVHSDFNIQSGFVCRSFPLTFVVRKIYKLTADTCPLTTRIGIKIS
jgi:hypothetical protein